ncbi:MAG: InlB B-repeat-containing protein [Bacteroidales bacterium]|nr:InlB B-repeat-containing protein [Bacteroidales bacterium]
MKARYLLFMLFIMASALNLRANDATWDYNPYAFQYDMTVYVALSSVDDKSITDASDYQIGAFCEDECRGIAEEKVIGEHRYVYLRIRSNMTEGETIHFRVRNTKTGKIAKVTETIDFKSQQTIGYPSSPFAINARNPYCVTFIIDGVEHRSDLFFGDVITVPTDTKKDGYTFVGWSPKVDARVPDHDVTYTATYTVNQYTITFDTDGGSGIAPLTQDYNSAVTAPADPTRTGYTFAGWDREIPSTMPAEDITVKALWTINQYMVTFIAEDVIVSEQLLDYGSQIIIPDAPEKEGYTFSSWGDVDETVPDHDVTYTATYNVNYYKLTYVLDGEVYAEFDVAFGETIVPLEVEPEEGRTFQGWVDVPETMPSHDVTIYGSSIVTSVNSSAISGSDKVSVYSLNGVLIKKDVDFKTLRDVLESGIYIVNGKKILIR